ncbi:MAG: glycosyltransferase family 2 protein [Bacteroidales bacterium]|nr:glycosyltransferase family 2 protein [Bacteroidales bacterium]
MLNPLISIIVPIYKVEKYLDECVLSLINQTYKNLEIILVDDGSPDNCGRMCDEYAAKDSRIKVIHKENGGLSDARNVAIDVAQGEWITFVDSDDYVINDYVGYLYDLVIKYSCEISIAMPCEFIDGQKPKCGNEKIIAEKLDSLYAVEQMFYQKKFDTGAWAKLYHRRLFELGIRYPKGLVYEDLATTYKLMLACKGVAFATKVVYYYRMRTSSIEGSFNPAKIQSVLSVAKLMDDDISLKKIDNAYKCRIFNFFFHILLTMPNGVKEKTLLEQTIIKYRYSVLTNSQARKKARLAAFLSYFGFNCVKFWFQFVRKR